MLWTPGYSKIWCIILSMLRLVNFSKSGVAELYGNNYEELERDGVLIRKVDFGKEKIGFSMQV